MSNHLVTPSQMCENFSQPEALPLTHSHTVETPAHRSGVDLGGGADQAPWHYGTLQSRIILPLILLIKQLPAIGVALNECNKFMEYGRSQLGAAEEPAQDILATISGTLQDRVGPLPRKRHQVRKLKAIALKYSNVLQRMEIQGALANVNIDTQTIIQTFASLANLLQEAEIYELPSTATEPSNEPPRAATEPSNEPPSAAAEPSSELPSAPPVRPRTVRLEVPTIDGYALLERFYERMPLPKGVAYNVSTETKNSVLFNWQEVNMREADCLQMRNDTTKIKSILAVSHHAHTESRRERKLQREPPVQTVPAAKATAELPTKSAPKMTEGEQDCIDGMHSCVIELHGIQVKRDYPYAWMPFNTSMVDLMQHDKIGQELRDILRVDKGRHGLPKSTNDTVLRVSYVRAHMHDQKCISWIVGYNSVEEATFAQKRLEARMVNFHLPLKLGDLELRCKGVRQWTVKNLRENPTFACGGKQFRGGIDVWTVDP